MQFCGLLEIAESFTFDIWQIRSHKKNQKYFFFKMCNLLSVSEMYLKFKYTET